MAIPYAPPDPGQSAFYSPSYVGQTQRQGRGHFTSGNPAMTGTAVPGNSVNPNADTAYAPPAPATGPRSESRTGIGHFNPAATAPGTSGTESGPGILEQWFNQRANGTDPGYQYAMTRGMNDIDSRMSAGGSYNSGARGQQLSDFASNMGAQREGQLDALAGGASGEHQGRLNAMFGQGMGLAGGQAGTMGQYDLASANSNNSLMNALVQMMAGKAGVDQKSNQSLINNVLAGATTYAALA